MCEHNQGRDEEGRLQEKEDIDNYRNIPYSVPDESEEDEQTLFDLDHNHMTPKEFTPGLKHLLVERMKEYAKLLGLDSEPQASEDIVTNIVEPEKPKKECWLFWEPGDIKIETGPGVKACGALAEKLFPRFTFTENSWGVESESLFLAAIAGKNEFKGLSVRISIS